MSVPIIDITPLLRNNNSLDARSCSDKIHKLCSEIGFLVITGHGIEKDLDQIFEIAKEFKKLPKFLQERKRVAGIYDKLFKESKLDIKVPETKYKDSTNAYFFYPILLNDRNNIAQALRSKHGIDTRIAYSMPVYDQHLYKSGQAKCRHTACPVAEEVTKKILNLPIFPNMDENSIKSVVNSIKSEIK